MEICFRNDGVFVVRFFSDADKDLLLNTVEALGVPIQENFRQSRRFIWPRDTCTFAIDLPQQRLEYIAEPFICAAMVSTGIRFYSVVEFCKLMDDPKEACGGIDAEHFSA